jgi:hypothetical protein
VVYCTYVSPVAEMTLIRSRKCVHHLMVRLQIFQFQKNSLPYDTISYTGLLPPLPLHTRHLQGLATVWTPFLPPPSAKLKKKTGEKHKTFGSRGLCNNLPRELTSIRESRKQIALWTRIVSRPVLQTLLDHIWLITPQQSK